MTVFSRDASRPLSHRAFSVPITLLTGGRLEVTFGAIQRNDLGAHWPSSRDHSLADILRKMDAIAVDGRFLDREESKRPVSALAGHADLTHQPSACAADCYHGTALDLEQKELMGGYAALTHKLGGEFVHLHGRSVAATLRDFIQASLATEVILGHRRSRWTPWDTTSELIRGLAGVDVHILRKRDTA